MGKPLFLFQEELIKQFTSGTNLDLCFGKKEYKTE